MAKILLVEDEDHIAKGLRFNLELDGHEVAWLADGGSAKEHLFTEAVPYDLVILDVMLPGLSGLDLARGLRKRNPHQAILMLSAKGAQADKLAALRLGADDYITKPFDLEELLLRVERLLARSSASADVLLTETAPPSTLRFGAAEVDFSAHTARMGDRPVHLTVLELELLRAFSRHEGQVLSREDLLREVWQTEADIATRTIDNFVLRLRKAFEPEPAQPVHFLSVRGRGYKFLRQSEGERLS